MEDARAFGQRFFAWYNYEHHHSGLGYLTPAVVHHGLANGVRDQRIQVLAVAYAAHPERFVRGVPRPAPLPTTVWINPPPKNSGHEDASGTTIVTPGDARVHPVSSAPLPISIKEVAL